MMKLAVTGFVSSQAGSVASANALLLRALLDRGCDITFFSKASFVDPRPAVGESPNFRFRDVDNRVTDRIRARFQRVPGLGMLLCQLDAACYNKLLVRRIGEAHRSDKFDLCVWLGDYARGSTAGLPSVSFAQGAPGTDARSIANHFEEIKKLSGTASAWRWKILSWVRLSFARPHFENSSHIVVGSKQSRKALQTYFGISPDKVSPLPYAIDLDLFRPAEPPSVSSRPLRCLWLGRIVPRKRLDLFLNGANLAIERGMDLRLTIAGNIGFVSGYEKLIAGFPHPDRLTWHRSVPRDKVPDLMREHDVLVQPSEEEDFGSSVAEAQACGLPVVVGATNGNADYLCSRDIHLKDYRSETLAEALAEVARRKEGQSSGVAESRRCAKSYFAIDRVADAFLEILHKVQREHR